MPQPISYKYGYRVKFRHSGGQFEKRFPAHKFQDPKQSAIDYINSNLIAKDAPIHQQRNRAITAIYPHMIQGWTVEKIMRYWEKITAGHCCESYRHRHKPALFMGKSPLGGPCYFGFKNYRVGGLVN